MKKFIGVVVFICQLCLIQANANTTQIEFVFPDSSIIQSIKIDSNRVKQLLIYADTSLVSIEEKFRIIDYAKEVSKKIDYQAGIINGYNIKGINLIKSGKHYEALLEFDSLNSYLLSKTANSDDRSLKIQLSKNYSNLGATYEEIGKLEKAMNLYYKSLSISEEIKDNRGIGRVLNNIGNYYFVNGEVLKAKDMFFKALKVNREGRNLNYIFDNLNNLSATYKRLGLEDSALVFANQALDIAVKNNWANEKATIHMNIADIHSALENKSKSKNHLFLAIAIMKEWGFSHDLGFGYLHLSDLYKIENKDSAIYYLNEASELSKSVKTLHFLSALYSRKYKLYKYYKMNDSALYYHEKYMEFHDSVFNIESKNKIEELNVIYQVDKKETQILFLEKQNRVKTRLQIFLIALVITVLVALVQLFFNFKARGKLVRQKQIIIDKNKELSELALREKDQQNKLLKEAQKLEEIEKVLLQSKLDNETKIRILEQEKFESEIKHKNRELSTSIMLINNKNEILQNIKEKLSVSAISHSPELKRIILDINSNVQLEKDWEQFKLHFEKVHVDFFKKLKIDHSELSENDLKLCAYLRLNMSTKEIAQMGNITVAAVNKQRQRLRKKMNLSANANFTDILMKY